MITVSIPNIKLDSAKAIEFIAQRLLRAVIDNISKSVNNDGVPFMPYSSLKKSGAVDLHETGRMLSQLQAKVEAKTIIIGVFGDRAEVAEKLNLTKNWTFLSWGKTLDSVYAKALEEFIIKAFEV